MTSRAVNPPPTPSATLIGNWAERVIELWQESRTPGLAVDMEELGDACRVRDQLNNRLHRPHPNRDETAGSMQMLRSADTLFRQFTTESRTATNLSCHNHYPHQSEWWWRRLPARLRTNP